MSKLLSGVFDRYQRIAASISLLPDDDFDNTFSHSAVALEKKIMHKTAEQMQKAFSDYLVEHPEILEDLLASTVYIDNEQLKIELKEQIKSAEKYVNERQLGFAF